MDDARRLFSKELPPQFLDHLERKGWIRRNQPMSVAVRSARALRRFQYSAAVSESLFSWLIHEIDGDDDE